MFPIPILQAQAVDPALEATRLLDLVAEGLRREERGPTRLRPMLETARRALPQPGPLVEARMRVLDGLLRAAEGQPDGDTRWGRAVLDLHRLWLQAQGAPIAVRLATAEALREALSLAELDDTNWRERMLDLRLAPRPPWSEELEKACLDLLRVHYRGWLDPRPPDLERLIPLARHLVELWLRLPSAPRTQRVLGQAVLEAGAPGVWELVATRGDTALRGQLAELLTGLEPAALDPADTRLWTALAEIGKAGWEREVGFLRRQGLQRLEASLKVRPRDPALRLAAAQWLQRTGALGEALAQAEAGLALGGGCREELLSLACRLAVEGRDQAALDRLHGATLAMEPDPRGPKARERLQAWAADLESMGAVPAALQVHRRLLAAGSGEATLGVAQLLLQVEGAAAALAFIEAQPGSEVAVRVQRARCLRMLGRRTEADAAARLLLGELVDLQGRRRVRPFGVREALGPLLAEPVGKASDSEAGPGLEALLAALDPQPQEVATTPAETLKALLDSGGKDPERLHDLAGDILLSEPVLARRALVRACELWGQTEVPGHALSCLLLGLLDLLAGRAEDGVRGCARALDMAAAHGGDASWEEASRQILSGLAFGSDVMTDPGGLALLSTLAPRLERLALPGSKHAPGSRNLAERLVRKATRAALAGPALG